MRRKSLLGEQTEVETTAQRELQSAKSSSNNIAENIAYHENAEKIIEEVKALKAQQSAIDSARAVAAIFNQDETEFIKNVDEEIAQKLENIL